MWVETSKDEVYDSSIQHVHLLTSYFLLEHTAMTMFWDGICHYNIICRNKSMVFSYDILAVWPGWAFSCLCGPEIHIFLTVIMCWSTGGFSHHFEISTITRA